MHRIAFAASLALLGPLLFSGCATAPVETAALQPPCSFLRVEQGGKPLAAAAGVVMVARAPFTLTYVGPGNEPSIHASSKPELGAWLARQGRVEIWMPLGIGMAASPGVLITDDKPQGSRDTESRKAVTSLVHARYWPMVREKVEARPLDVAVRVGVNTWWEPARAGAPRVYRVATLNEGPIGRSTLEVLHLVAFGETERIVAGAANTPMLARTRWNACTVKFST